MSTSRTRPSRAKDKDLTSEVLIPHLVHALRNSVSSVKLAVQILSAAKPTDERSRKSLALASREIDRLERTLSVAVELVKPPTAGSPALAHAVDLGALLPRTLEVLRPELEARQVRAVLEPMELPVPTFIGSPDRVRICLESLLAGIARAVPEQGLISVGLVRRGQSLELEIRDPGPRLSEAEQADLFRPLARSVRSSGLDLPLVARVAAELGGSLRARNLDGNGVAVTWSIPLIREVS